MKFYEIGRNESGARIYESELTFIEERIYAVFSEEPGLESMRSPEYIGMSPERAKLIFGKVSGYNVEHPKFDDAIEKDMFDGISGIVADFYVEALEDEYDVGFYVYSFF